MKRTLQLVALGLIVITALSIALTWSGAGVAAAEEPQGVSLRQESERRPGAGFFAVYRGHRGGGPRSGK